MESFRRETDVSGGGSAWDVWKMGSGGRVRTVRRGARPPPGAGAGSPLPLPLPLAVGGGNGDAVDSIASDAA